jgi:hypothetical protein
MPQPNMKKEYRAELKTLRKNRGHVLRDWKAFAKHRAGLLRAMTREINGAERNVRRNLDRFDKRIAILEGRLS